MYLLFLKPCSFDQEPGLNHWNGGNTLFTNWSHSDQMLTSDSLTFEQCTFKAFETDTPYMTYNFNDGRCICKDSAAVLTVSSELSTAFTNGCSSESVTTSTNQLIADYAMFLYPNPTTSDVVIKTTETLFSPRDEIRVYNLMGQLLLSSNISSQRTEVDLSLYPNGLYFFNANINGASRTVKVVKE